MQEYTEDEKQKENAFQLNAGRDALNQEVDFEIIDCPYYSESPCQQGQSRECLDAIVFINTAPRAKSKTLRIELSMRAWSCQLPCCG